MNQDNKYIFPFEEDPNLPPAPASNISDDIAADVSAMLDDALDPSVDIGIGVEAIMAEAQDPSTDIGADVAAIMEENKSHDGIDIPNIVQDVYDPTTDIGADVAAIMEETQPVFEFAPASPTEYLQDVAPASPDEFSPVVEDHQESAEATAFFHVPELIEVTPDATGSDICQEQDAPSNAQEVPPVDFSDFDVPVETPANAENGATDAPVIAQCTDIPTPFAADRTQRVDPVDPLHHDLLNDPLMGDEINADENAISIAGLTHPSSTEQETIISEGTSDAADQASAANPINIGTDSTVEIEDLFPAQPTDMLIQDYVDPSQPTIEKEKAEIPEKPLPKRRPKHKKGYGFFGLPHVASMLIWLVITVAIGVSLGRMIWVCTAEVLAFGKPDQEHTITITTADNIDTVAAKLKNAGLIKYPELFKLYAGITDAEEELSAGTFVLNSKYDYNALVKAMTFHSTARKTVKVLIPEGYTCAQIFALLEEKGVCTVAELEEYAANGEIKDRWFLEGIKRGDKYCLEGYLFPDSYEFYTNDDPARVFGKFLDNFDTRFTTIMKEKIDPLNEQLAKVLASRGYTQDYIDAHKITIREIVIIASMIERETANDAESYDIASVIYNRLTNPANYPYLNIDATIIYALGGNIDPATGKTMPLTKEDLQLDSPYNTYTYPGLIPGPISNPGRNSLNAALDPNTTNFYFYVYNPNISKHLFAKTADEHNKNVEYVRSLDDNT